jgi:ornithine cyclodeaminase/alanine dehydrogenase-like protein (mu-crystallin family)
MGDVSASVKTRVLSRDDTVSIVTRVGIDRFMDELIERISDCARDFDPAQYRIPERSGFHYDLPSPGLLEWMPVMGSEQQATIKIVGYHPDNPRRHGLPTIIGMLGAFDLNTGCLVGIADGTLLTALRTAATSAAISRVLAVPSANVLGLIGCGAQAVAHCHALLRVFPLQRVLIHDVDRAAEESFARRIARFAGQRLTVEPTSIADMLQRSDVLCTATSIAPGAGPLFEDSEINPALHINAVGSDFPGTIELPVALLRRAAVFPDHREQCVKEGECQQLQPHEIGPSLFEVLQRSAFFSSYASQLTVFDSTGWALEDQIAMDMLLEYAERLQIGKHLSLHHLPNDPLNPYDF